MTKIVYNACFGGFGLSDEAIMRYAEIKGITLYPDRKSYAVVYYLCPVEEYERIYAEEINSKTGFARSNELYFGDRNIERTDPVLVQVVEELGDAANGDHAKLRIKEVPAGTLYRIDEYDGRESVMTQDSYDWSMA